MRHDRAMLTSSACVAALGLSLVAACRAGPTAPAEPVPAAPAAAPTQPAPAPATQPAAPDPAVLDLLDRIESKAAEVRTFQATVRWDYEQGLLGDKQRRFGVLYYVAGPPAQFAAHLDKRIADQTLDAQDRWYVFDGTWLAEKIADQKPKRFTRWQIVPKGADPAQADPLALGAGPFPLPVNMRKDVVLARFQAAIVPPDKDDPADSVHLKLTPRPGVRVDATRLDFWYQRDSLLPLRVRKYDQPSDKDSVVNLSQHKLNQTLDHKAIDTTEPREPGWEVHVHPIQDQ